MEKFDCGCSITFGSDGQVRAVNVCEKKHASIFSDHKSLKQLALDIQHEQMKEKHAPKPPPVEAKTEEPAKS